MAEILAGLDLETSGVDVFNDRIVTFHGAVYDGDKPIQVLSLLIDPGVDIPEEAAEVHGISTEYAGEHGLDAFEGLLLIQQFLEQIRFRPLTVMNASFDLSMLNAEFYRHGLEPFDWNNWRIFDSLVMDRGLDRYRKGKRKLINLAEHYGVPVDEERLHTADFDVETTVKVTRKILQKYGEPTMDDQKAWHLAWSENFQEYLRKNGDENATIDGQWPYRTM